MCRVRDVRGRLAPLDLSLQRLQCARRLGSANKLLHFLRLQGTSREDQRANWRADESAVISPIAPIGPKVMYGKKYTSVWRKLTGGGPPGHGRRAAGLVSWGALSQPSATSSIPSRHAYQPASAPHRRCVQPRAQQPRLAVCILLSILSACTHSQPPVVPASLCSPCMREILS